MRKIILAITGIFLLFAPTAHGMIQGPLVTFRFDDRGAQTYKYARPIMGEYGYKGVLFIPIYKIGQDGNIKWWQLKNLYNEGWEIGAHGYDIHCDYRTLSLNEVDRQLRLAKEAYRGHGFKIKTYASPEGYYNKNILSLIKKYYSYHAATRPYGTNIYPWPDYSTVVRIWHGDSMSADTVKDWVDEAYNTRTWLIILIHGLVPGEPQRPSQVNIEDFRAIVEYVNNRQIPVVTIKQAHESF